MRYAALFAVIVVYCCPVIGDDTATPQPDPISTVHLPMKPVLVEPDSFPPAPPVDPGAPKMVDSLSAEQWYVIESGFPLMVYGVPDGIVGITEDGGPVKVRGVFADGTGTTETRVFSQPYLYFVNAIGTGSVELQVIPSGTTDKTKILRPVLQVTVAPRPPPVKPVDPVKPDVPDPPDDPVVPVGKIQVVIIEDPDERAAIPASQIAAMEGRVIREYAKTHCQTTEGVPDFRLLSLRQNVSKQPDWIKEAFAVPRPETPFIVILTGSKTISGPLPKTVEDTLALLQKYGGK